MKAFDDVECVEDVGDLLSVGEEKGSGYRAEVGPTMAEFRSAVTERFHGEMPPNRVVRYERSYHRHVASLAAEGFNYTEIASMTGFTIPTISNLLRQPWMQETITRLIAETSDKVLMELRGEALGAARRIVELSKDFNINPEVRRKANNDVLDRVYGKPNQPMTHRTVDPSKMSDEELLTEYNKSKGN